MSYIKFLRGLVAAAALALCGYMPTSALATSCLTINSVLDFSNAGSCTSGDQTFNYVGTDLNANTALSFVSQSGGTVKLVFQTVELGPLSSNYFNYTTSLSNTSNFFSQVLLDSTVNALASGESVTKYISGFPQQSITLLDTITSTNGSIDASISLLPLHLKFLSIHETLNVGPNGYLYSVGNAFVQAIPEPEIYAMMAAGLGLMGWVARRRKGQSALAY